MTICWVYMTAGSKDEAKRVGHDLVEGKLNEDTEAILIAKTREALIPRLVDRVKETHSYDCPCVVALPVKDGNPAFIEWVGAQTAGAIG